MAKKKSTRKNPKLSKRAGTSAKRSLAKGSSTRRKTTKRKVSKRKVAKRTKKATKKTTVKKATKRSSKLSKRARTSAKRSLAKGVAKKATKKTSKRKTAKKSGKFPTVKVYSTPTCPYCKMAKDFLKSKKVPFKSIDVTSDPKYVVELQMKSGQMGVPVIDIGGKIVIGFDEAKIRKLLKL